MKTDLLQQYMSTRTSLQHERESLLTRLRQIENALGTAPTPTLGLTGRRGRRGNPMPLRDAVQQVTANQPMTKDEILQAVQRLGYRFTGKDPANVLGVVLYGKNPRFRNDDGRFSPIRGTAAVPSTGRRMISVAGRARIAQRARWARARATNGAHKSKRTAKA